MSFKKFILFLLIGGVLAILAEKYGPGGVQRRGLKAAEDFRQSVLPKLKADPRFANIEIEISTAVYIGAYGNVPDETALRDLKRIMIPAGPVPFAVRISAEIIPPRPTTKSATTRSQP